MQLKRGKTELQLRWIGALGVAVKNTEVNLVFGKNLHLVEVKYYTRAMCDQYVPHVKFNHEKSPHESFLCLNSWSKFTMDLNMDNHNNTVIIAVDYRKDLVAELTLANRRIFIRLRKGNRQKECTIRVERYPMALDMYKDYTKIIREQPCLLKYWRPNIPIRPRLADLPVVNSVPGGKI